MFILIHIVVRTGQDKTTRRIIFNTQSEAIEYIRDLREHETIILFKQYFSRGSDRRNAERILSDPKKDRRNS